eukprot:m.1248744 g.1248744  ORF g.1248744 m.1248744 type:complete len:413 (-) comp24699_c0_seq1:4343-5581(-)
MDEENKTRKSSSGVEQARKHLERGVRFGLNPYVLSFVVCMVLVFVIPISITFSRPKSEPWSHRCISNNYGENTVAGCKDVVENGFLGIEVDIRYENSSIYIKHDEDEIANETLRDLFVALDGYDYQIYIDMKTEEPGDIFAFDFLSLLLEFDMLQRSFVEVYNEKLRTTLRRFDVKVIMAGHVTAVDGEAMTVAQWWIGIPWYSMTLNHIFVFTANTECQYAELQWGRPSVILVNFTQPHVRDCDAGTGAGIAAYMLYSIVAIAAFGTCVCCCTHRCVRLRRLTRKDNVNVCGDSIKVRKTKSNDVHIIRMSEADSQGAPSVGVLDLDGYDAGESQTDGIIRVSQSNETDDARETAPVFTITTADDIVVQEVTDDGIGDNVVHSTVVSAADAPAYADAEALAETEDAVVEEM